MAQYGINFKNAEAIQIAPEHLDSYWGEVAPLLNKLLDSCSGEFDLESFYNLIKSGGFSLLAFHAAGDIRLVALMEFVQYPKKKVLRFVGCAGENPAVAYKFLPAVEVWARENGATELESLVLPEAEKYAERMGFKSTYKLMRKNIKEQEDELT